MKKLIILSALIIPVLLVAQNTEGIIRFEEKMDMHARFGDSPEDLEIKKMMPQYNTTYFELLFNADATLYRTETKSEEEDAEHAQTNTITLHGGQGMFKAKMNRPQNTYYKDFKSSQKIEQRYFFDKAYLISEDMSPVGWKLTGQAKSILGHECQQATLQQGEDDFVEAWFAPSIPLTGGPASFSHLPGMILEVILDDGNRTITAVEINYQELNSEEMIAPTKGKKITEEKYEKMVEERMREMGAQSNGRGGFKVIRIDRGNN